MRTALWGLAVGVWVWGSVAMGAVTTPVKTLPWGTAAFVQDPNLQIIYATVPSLNSVAVIDASTLSVITTVGIGSNPKGLTLSPDGSRLYVANSGSSFVGVIDTATRQALAPIALAAGAGSPQGVQYGTNGRLWVLSSNGIEQINPSTGASTGPNTPAGSGDGAIRISSDRKSLYFAEFGSSPSDLYRFDVTGTTPTQTWAMATGSNGEDLELSHNNNTVVQVQGGGNGPGYGIIPFRTSDKLATGTMNVGAYPYSFAYSPDDKVGYAGVAFQSPNIQIYDLNTFLKMGTITAADDPDVLFVDNSGRYLFADVGNTTQVFSTGRSVPEPVGLGVIAVGGAVWMGRRGRRGGRARSVCG
jgi:YVTN family beta-propeller protein